MIPFQKRIVMSDYVKNMSDLTLVKLVSEGCADALKELMDRHMEVVSLTAFRILCDHERSVKVVRRVFADLWKKVFEYDYSLDIRNWLLVRVVDISRKMLVKDRIAAFFGIKHKMSEHRVPKVNDVDDYITAQAWEVFCRASKGMCPTQRIAYTLRELDLLSENISEHVSGLSKERFLRIFARAKEHVKSELAKLDKLADYKPYLRLLRNVRDTQADYAGLEEEILYLCVKFH